MDCEIVGASVDSVYTHRAWTQTPRDQNGIGPVKFPLVSDFSKETARAYGVLMMKQARLIAVCSLSTQKAYCATKSLPT